MRTTLTVLVLLIGGWPVFGQFEKLETKTREALRVNKPYRALTLTERALTRKDAPALFHTLRAEAYNRIGEYGKAMEQLRRAGAEQRMTADHLINSIGAYTGLGRLDSAAALIPSVPPAMHTEEYAYRAGRVYFLQNDWSAALSIFNAGIERTGATARLLRERGACHAMLGDSARAREDLDKAIALSPRQAAAYNSRGYYAHMIFGRYEQAIADMDRAIKHDPNYGYAFSNRGWCYYKIGETEKARRDLSLAIRKDPSNAYAQRSLGVIAMETGDVEEGCARLRKARDLGFAAVYGAEVDDLMNAKCPTEPTSIPAPALAPTAPAVPDRTNAPGGNSPRTNAP